ncbi:permease-like cell division protein FtsX [Acidithiobacillus sp. M4-SHS-6]|uniref:permease-like cell division protein FtsX n=1 Tax=Acidithiobacillus sp. M4-SHS-6 TaxID=3383024 RepID=UPI0039BDD36D
MNAVHVRLEAAQNALHTLVKQPLATLMTIFALAIVLALPVGLFAALNNLQQLLGQWRDQAQISLFLHQDATAQDIQQLQKKLQGSTGVVNVRYVGKTAALQEFEKNAGMTAAIRILGENPLPASFIVELNPLSESPAALQAQIQAWSRQPGVASAQSDLHWVARLQAILALGKTAVWILTILLAVGAILVMGNTIRLHIAQRRDEIDIASLVGATRSFIRRPFLYQGLLQGAIAGTLAWIIIAITIAILQGPVDRLATLYGTRFELLGLTGLEGVILIAISAILGWLGSRLAVGQHLDHTFS